MLSQIFAIAIFLIMFLGIVAGKIPRHIITTVAALATALLVFLLIMRSPQSIWEALALHSVLEPDFWFARTHGTVASTGINWGTILFIAGMMILVEGWRTPDSSGGCVWSWPKRSAIASSRCS